MGTAEKYQLAIIGAGPGGYVAAIRAGQLGIKTALVEREYLGGVCLNWGCIPSKALLYACELRRQLESARQIGLEAENIRLDLEKLRRHKDESVKRLTGGVRLLLEKAGVTVISAKARFVSANEVELDGANAPPRLAADHFIIATGAAPIELPQAKVDGNLVVTAREAIELPRVPRAMAVIGAGPIGAEMATIYNTLGAKVTIIELLGAVLPTLDSDISTAAERALKKRGVEIFLSSRVISSQLQDGYVKLVWESPGSKEERLFDMVLVAVGMKPNSYGLGLEEIGVKTNEKGFIEVSRQMRTSVPNIYAIGDVTGGMLLAHKASHEGIAAVEAIAGNPSGADWKAVPYAVFTDPEIAGVGLSENEAKRLGRKLKVGKFPYRAAGKGLVTLAGDGFAKVVSDAATDEVLGVHLFGPHSADIIMAGTLLLEFDGTTEDLGHAMAVHPTLTEALMEAALNADKKAIHIVN